MGRHFSTGKPGVGRSLDFHVIATGVLHRYSEGMGNCLVYPDVILPGAGIMVRMLGYWTSIQLFSAGAFGNLDISVVLYWHEKKICFNLPVFLCLSLYGAGGKNWLLSETVVLVWVRLYFPIVPLGYIQ